MFFVIEKIKMEAFCKLAFIIIAILLLTAKTDAQQFGATPSSIKWQQINTDTVSVIYPAGIDSIAQRVAALTTYEARNYQGTIGDVLRKVNIVLRNNVTYSNGYVALAPYRSEFYLQPSLNPFELGAQSMVDNLSLHEFRHVQQYSNFKKGLSKTMYVLFGEGGQALANAAAVPDWFFEGDAVYNETLLSHQGRGRIPYFFNGFKSLYLNGKGYSYMKLRNGSFRNYVPDHYRLGYLLVAYGREKYGADFWKNVTSDAVRFKHLFYPLQNAVKKYTGTSYKKFVLNAFDFYHEQWKKDASQKIDWITLVESGNVVNYKYPYATKNNSLIVLKSSYKKVPAFYELANGKERKIVTKDISYDDYFSYNNNEIVYTSYHPDARYRYREYSVIRLADVNTGEEKRITNHTKYFTPDISHNGKLIAAVAIHPNLRCDIDILNKNGEVIRSLIKNSNSIYAYPKFSENDSSVLVTVRNEIGQMSLQQRYLYNDSVKTILPFANRLLGFPIVQGDTLLYNCSNDGRDEIWATIISQNKTYRVAGFSTGLYQAAFNENHQLIASAFTAEGYRLGTINPQYQNINESDTLIGLYVKKPFHIPANNTVVNAPQSEHYATDNYLNWSHPFNFHSWQPSINDPDYSFSLYGENILNTLQHQLYYTYNRNEGFSRIGYNAIYGGWYVQPVIGINQTFKRSVRLINDTSLYWNEFNASAGLQLPLNFSGGKHYRYLTLSSTYNINSIRYKGLAKELRANSNFQYVETRISYSEQAQKALQQIYPHWAQSFLVQYRHAITHLTAWQFLLRGNIYLPGFFNNHSFVISAAWQKADTLRNYSYSNNFPFSRGYTAYYAPQMWRLGANYHLPLLYPDRGFGNIIYFQRVRGNLFFDFTQLIYHPNGDKRNYNFKSLGGEIYFDTKWWNQQPITLGIRYSRLLNYKFAGQQPNQWEFILPVNIFSP